MNSGTLMEMKRRVERRARVGLVLGILLPVAVGLVGGGIVWSFRRALRTPDAVFDVTDAGVLRDAVGTPVGVSWRAESDGTWRVFVTVRLDPLPDGRAYHAWLTDEGRENLRYMGEMFPAQDGRWSVTYSTEEDVATFARVLVSRERVGSAVTRPTEAIAIWSL